MSKRVLDVGNCVPDHAALRRLVEGSFDAQLFAADDLADTLSQLKKQPADLVIVNRKLDKDYSDGMDIIRQLKSHADYGNVPVMLLSNYPEYQQQAIADGAEPGFGKQELRTSDTLAKLKRFLN